MKKKIATLSLSTRTASLQPSKIREVAELGMSISNVIPLWFGEGGWPTSNHIVDTATSELKAGNHFYQPNNGRPSLRREISDYTHHLYGTPVDPNRITVTASGMQGLTLVAQAIVSPNDRVVVIEPLWPNIAQAFKISGADIHRVMLKPKDKRWHLDMEALFSALTPKTKAVIINSPNNPTGWAMSAHDQIALLKHCRKLGIWIIADDVYARLYRGANVAPSFQSLTDKDDLFISINSFSKAWSMTGWRLGWINAPGCLEKTFAQLSEFNIAGPAGFVQAAGEVALREGEEDIAILGKRLSDAYAIVAQRLSEFDRVEFIEPEGAFYCFFNVAGTNDSVALAKTLLQETGVGLAPGSAFGEAGEGYLRLCYAQDRSTLIRALDRLAPHLHAPSKRRG
ncbi:Aspartate aminotransferase [hydrothermal vent metagenome]|uniref:Aspartate aminotransferase n=1 Tax=hydrothermal vent metagenome TaxID=652676 RepID=A0A3B1B2G9_9ZZZZ